MPGLCAIGKDPVKELRAELSVDQGFGTRLVKCGRRVDDVRVLVSHDVVARSDAAISETKGRAARSPRRVAPRGGGGGAHCRPSAGGSWSCRAEWQALSVRKIAVRVSRAALTSRESRSTRPTWGASDSGSDSLTPLVQRSPVILRIASSKTMVTVRPAVLLRSEPTTQGRSGNRWVPQCVRATPRSSASVR